MGLERLDEKLLQSSEHRLRALSAELFDAFKQGLLDGNGYQTRLQNLNHLESELALISERRRGTKSAIDAIEHSNLDLPILSDCSRAEQEMILSLLEETLHALNSENKKISKLNEIVFRAHTGDMSFLSGIFSLSWIRKQLQLTINRSEAVRNLRGALESFVKKLRPKSASQTGNLNVDIIATYKEFEAITNRINDLKSKIATESTKLNEQRRWLVAYEERRRASLTLEAPPRPQTIKELLDQRVIDLEATHQMVDERVSIAKKLTTEFGKANQSTIPVLDLFEVGKSEFAEVNTAHGHYHRKMKKRQLKKVAR